MFARVSQGEDTGKLRWPIAPTVVPGTRRSLHAGGERRGTLLGSLRSKGRSTTAAAATRRAPQVYWLLDQDRHPKTFLPSEPREALHAHPIPGSLISAYLKRPDERAQCAEEYSVPELPALRMVCGGEQLIGLPLRDLERPQLGFVHRATRLSVRVSGVGHDGFRVSPRSAFHVTRKVSDNQPRSAMKVGFH